MTRRRWRSNGPSNTCTCKPQLRFTSLQVRSTMMVRPWLEPQLGCIRTLESTRGGKWAPMPSAPNSRLAPSKPPISSSWPKRIATVRRGDHDLGAGAPELLPVSWEFPCGSQGFGAIADVMVECPPEERKEHAAYRQRNDLTCCNRNSTASQIPMTACLSSIAPRP